MKDAKTPLKVDIGKAIETVTSEVVSFIKSDGTADAGEAAGTIVYGQLSKSPVLNKIGDREGEYTGEAISTSITFTTGVMDSTKEVGFVYDARANDRLTLTSAKLTENGQWACDYFTGLLVVRKATTGTTQTITSYKARRSNMSATVDSEFPTSSAASDNYANPTTTDVKSFNMVWDGSTWDRLPGNSSTGASVTQSTQLAGESIKANQSDSRMMMSKPGDGTRITTATTTTVLTGTGILASVLIEAALTGTVTIYDNTAGSGTIKTILPIGFAAGVYPLNIKLSIGCTLVTSAADRVVVVIDPN